MGNTTTIVENLPVSELVTALEAYHVHLQTRPFEQMHPADLGLSSATASKLSETLPLMLALAEAQAHQ